MKTKTTTEMTDEEILESLESTAKTQAKILAANAKRDEERGIKGAVWVNGLPQKRAPNKDLLKEQEIGQAEDKRKARERAEKQGRETDQARIIRVTRKWVSDNGFHRAIDDESVVALVTWVLKTEDDPKKAQQEVFKQLTVLVDKKRRT